MPDATRTHLFIDNEFISRTARLSRVYEQPKKFGPVVQPDRPWEHNCVTVYGSVLPKPDGSGYQMWYQNFSRHERAPGRAVFCYAESNDGVNWRKPSLGLFEREGTRDNNVVMVHWGTKWLSTLNVVYDDDEPREERRYKILFSTADDAEGPGLFVAFSPDGVRWDVNRKPVRTDASDRTTLLHDPGAEFPFVAYTRRHGMMDEFRSRAVYRSVSRDFLSWTPPEPVLAPDLRDSWDVQFYGMPAFRYRDLYIGGLKRLWSTPDRIDTELVTSRDGVNWNRTRHTFLENGPEGSWDSRWIALASSPPVDMGETLYFYHEGRAQAHHDPAPFPRGSIGLAVLKKDRFAALEAGPAEGFVVTQPFVCTGGGLAVNADATGLSRRVNSHTFGGAVRVEVLDETGAPIPGFTRDDAVAIHGDELSRDVRWHGVESDRPLDAFTGRTISLKIYLTASRLYAITCGA